MDGFDEEQRTGFVGVRRPTGEQLAEHPVIRIHIRQNQRRQCAGGPEPVFGEGLLHAGHHRSTHLHMGIAPRRQGRFLAHVFVADVVPADEAQHPVHDHDLAVVAKVDLKAIKPAAAGREGFDLDASLAQRLHIAVGQGVTADPVVQQVNRHAFGGFLQQQVLQIVDRGGRRGR